MVKGYYKCECGKEFDNPQKFNNHKSHCPDHCLAKHGSLVPLQERRIRNRARLVMGIERKRIRQQEEEMQHMQQWIAEQHRCEYCGRVMTDMYGSGRFCSASCAHYRNLTPQQLEVQRQRAIDNLVYGKNAQAEVERRKLQARNRYERSPKKCSYCGSPIPYEQRTRNTCSDECKHQRLREAAIARVQKYGGNPNTLGFRSYKQGDYDGIHFNSSWELAYYVYSQDHNIMVYRNTTESFIYELDRELHLYFPDFILEDGTFVEIKGRITKAALAKREQFPIDRKYLFLTYEDLKPMLNYCKQRYGTKFWESLYDKKE